MRTIEVTTKDELKSAVDAGYDEIKISGDLAKKVKNAYKIKKYSKVAVAALVTAIGATAVTGPLGLAFAAPIAVVTGMEIAVILAVIFLGIGFVFFLTDHYDVDIEITTNPPAIIIRKKKSV